MTEPKEIEFGAGVPSVVQRDAHRAPAPLAFGAPAPQAATGSPPAAKAPRALAFPDAGPDAPSAGAAQAATAGLRVPGKLQFTAPPSPPPPRPSAGEPARALFGEAGHPLLERCFQAARDRFARLYPAHRLRIERAIRQLLPPRLQTVAGAAEASLAASGEAVEAVARLMREFNELDAARVMADLLARTTRKEGLLDRIFHGRNAEVDFRAVLTVLKQALSAFPPRTEALAATIQRAEESLMITLAALGAVADVVQAPDEPALERALADRRDVVSQAVQQLALLPLQLRGVDEKTVDLLSRADHLMNVTLPAAMAARSQGL